MSIAMQHSEQQAVRLQPVHGLANGAAIDQTPNLTAPRIREAIAVLFQQGRIELATAVSEAAITLYPYSEDVLVMCALLAEVNQNWETAEQLLVRLIETQGNDAPAESWLHLVRVLRCQGKDEDANLICNFTSERFPEHKDLGKEAQELRKTSAKV